MKSAATTPTYLRREPRQQRSRDRVDTIIGAASALLAESGPDGMTITAVAERTGLATGSIYDYVESDRQLIRAVAQRGLDRIHQDLVQVIGSPLDLDDLVASLTQGLRLFLGRLRSDAGLREALCFVDADPLLAAINLSDTRRNAAVIVEAAASLNPCVVLAPAAALLVTHLSGALAALAAQVDQVEAAELIEQFEQMMAVVLTPVVPQ